MQPKFIRTNFHIGAPTPFSVSGTIALTLNASQWLLTANGGIGSRLVDDPCGQSALGLLRCSERGRLSNSRGLHARTNKAPAPANPYVFRHLLSELDRFALRDIRGTSNNGFDFTA